MAATASSSVVAVRMASMSAAMSGGTHSAMGTVVPVVGEATGTCEPAAVGAALGATEVLARDRAAGRRDDDARERHPCPSKPHVHRPRATSIDEPTRPCLLGD